MLLGIPKLNDAIHKQFSMKSLAIKDGGEIALVWISVVQKAVIGQERKFRLGEATGSCSAKADVDGYYRSSTLLLQSS